MTASLIVALRSEREPNSHGCRRDLAQYRPTVPTGFLPRRRLTASVTARLDRVKSLRAQHLKMWRKLLLKMWRKLLLG
jgi:hypothetical protein